MLYGTRVKDLYQKIQNKLFYMIPEKWDKICLYASVLEKMDDVLSGEMYFYYFPKGILKRNPINVYEIPAKFNIQENEYSEELKELYEYIKELWKEFKDAGHRLWFSVTISIQNTRFKVEYDYEDITLSQYSLEQRHIIWMYRNINDEYESYSKKDKAVIDDYLENGEEEDKETAEEDIYRNVMHNEIQYAKV